MMTADSADPEYPDPNFAQEKEIETYIASSFLYFYRA
jgi:hypothetical protein